MVFTHSVTASSSRSNEIMPVAIEDIQQLHPPESEGVFIESLTSDLQSTSLTQGLVKVGRSSVRWTLEVPENPLTDSVGIFVPGYLGIKQSSRTHRSTLAREQGIANLTYSPARQSENDWRDILTDPQELHVNTIGLIIDDLREREQEIKNKIPGGSSLDLGKFVLKGHSMGGLAIPRFALKEPGSVVKLIGLMPAGFGYPTLAALATDTPKNIYGSIKNELVPAIKNGNIEISRRNISDLVHYYGRLRFLFEGLSCLRDDVRPIVQELRDKGIPFDHLAAKHDFLVRPDQAVQDHVSYHKILDNIGHLGPQAKPSVVARFVAERTLEAA